MCYFVNSMTTMCLIIVASILSGSAVLYNPLSPAPMFPPLSKCLSFKNIKHNFKKQKAQFKKNIKHNLKKKHKAQRHHNHSTMTSIKPLKVLFIGSEWRLGCANQVQLKRWQKQRCPFRIHDKKVSLARITKSLALAKI